ncbi:MAG: hypothetical protein RBR09_00375 [Desulfobulbaceae bacterium]|jgi:hypothetical protein|nr:hypothetical protein [Desulfobulbaceae bacterium]MDY0349685.1 hypothetical protein [Desulfobulbaceae bacterium]
MTGRSFPSLLLHLFLFLQLILPMTAGAAAPGQNAGPTPGSPWSFSLRGGSLHHFEAGLEERGDFNVSRFVIQGGAEYAPGSRRSIALTAGYGFEQYDFAAGSLIPGQTPWEDIHTVWLTVPVRWGMENDWTLFVLPSLRWSAESGASREDALTGGLFAAAAYRFSDRLTAGPGLGITSRLEDSASLFPFLLIKWKVTERLTLAAGEGSAAIQGPGLTLDWKAAARWHLLFGGGYGQQRFRLDDRGPVPGGIGEKTSFPLFIGATCEISPQVRADIFGGVEAGGELRLEDRDGRLMAEEDFDPAVFLGAAFAGRF